MARFLALAIFVVVACVSLYLMAALVGARWPNVVATIDPNEPKTHRVMLITGALHADIAFDVTPEIKRDFAFLSKTTFPISYPNLKTIAFGWGSHAFYTTAGSYSDIRPGAVFKAVTGDKSVMRVTGFGNLSGIKDIIVLDVSSFQLQKILTAIKASFVKDQLGEPVHMNGISIGPTDAFFQARGHFNVFHPCNQWVNGVLSNAGIAVGAWTPTTFSLRQSLIYFGASQP